MPDDQRNVWFSAGAMGLWLQSLGWTPRLTYRGQGNTLVKPNAALHNNGHYNRFHPSRTK